MFVFVVFFFCICSDPAPTGLYTYIHTLSLHDAHPISAAIVDDQADTIRAELDCRREAAAMTEFADNLACHATNQRCVVPRPIEGMVAERVLVMTYVDGTPVDDGTPLRAAGHDSEDLVRSGVRAWLGRAPEHGLFHVDVHAVHPVGTPPREHT